MKIEIRILSIIQVVNGKILLVFSALFLEIVNQYFICKRSCNIQGHDHVTFAAFPSPPHRESVALSLRSTKHSK